MTTLPSAASTMSTLPIDDMSITHSGVVDNSQLGNCDTLMKKNPSTDIDQHHLEPTYRAHEHDPRRLDLNNSPQAVENVKVKRSNSLPTILSDLSDSSSSSFNHQRLVVSYAGDGHNEQFHLSSSSIDDKTADQPPFPCDQCLLRQDEQLIESQPLNVSNQASGIICLWCSRGYHLLCWERIAGQDDNMQCDYGIFRNIIVRPQWLSRSSESPTGFIAGLTSESTKNNFESNSFPYTPVIVFINKRSGGQQGNKIYRELLRALNPRQVFLLEDNATITHAFNIYSSLPNTRFCICGGDGTVCWILGRLAEAYPSRNNPPVSICPLGTGNDLSRVLAWGEQYDSKRLFQTLLQIPQAKVVALDRWEVQLEQLDMPILSSSTQHNRKSIFQIDRIPQLFAKHPKFVLEKNQAAYDKNHHKLPNTRFINYMSFGLDAAITLDFHDKRTRDPSKFSSPWKNKLMYLNRSCKYFSDFAQANMWNLGSYIRLICDGRNLTDAIRDCHTLVVLNISGYASGTNPWGKSSSRSSFILQSDRSSISQRASNSANDRSVSSVNVFDSLVGAYVATEPVTLNEWDTHQMGSSSMTTTSTDCFDQQDFGDKKVEVVGLTTTHMATIHMGFSGKRIAQCNQLRIELCSPMTAQMDGEPFYLPSSVAVNINHAGQVLVLKNQNE
ncbi:unnamed protein product [Rotaria sp. Silwood2]|nr:unnamed protein product [Rotaria sp. Silwood2]